MAGLAIMCLSLLGGLLLGTFVASWGWLFSLIGVPMILFVKIICTNDDKAIRILMLEVKWSLLKALNGNAKYHGGTMAIAPTTYGRKLKMLSAILKNSLRVKNNYHLITTMSETRSFLLKMGVWHSFSRQRVCLLK
ncbi:hypothetical protein MRX58_12680 (plasmid) [Xylella fastidiosa subsp. pauca]|uniref:hypothetical protein n=1 Tax=Xylella fastidiosa TaxID=2371 RepID=UPI00241F0306|nr:hypothetical protein [Xylella fastidiosa]MDG5824369.1 hypothetical protein [Xylella fastidiosa subsp. pauca]